MNRDAFSLIELLVVLTLISLVAVSVSVRWSESYKRVEFQSAVERFLDMEASTRRVSRRVRRNASIMVDLGSESVSATRWNDGVAHQVQYTFPSGVNLNMIRVGQIEASEGQHQIAFDQAGAGPTWAIKLQRGNQQQWLVFAGRTGQQLEFGDDEAVEEFFKKMQVNGINAD
ncbi:MAG: type II secretion system protein [Planctomycetota bacterium]